MENTHESMLAGQVNDALRTLGEHFDAIQIIGSYVDDYGNTFSMSLGVGNWYARQGLAREFMEKDAAQTTAFELSKVFSAPGDDE